MRTDSRLLRFARAVGIAFHFFLPALSVYLLFVLIPIVQSVYLSFFEWDGVAGEMRWAGLANYAWLLRDPVFWRALLNNVLVVATSLAIQIPLAIFLAVLLTRTIFWRGFFRTVCFAPMVVPTVAVGLLWSLVYLPRDGMLDRFIGLFREGFAFGWLGDARTALAAVILAICWRHTGFHMVLFMAGIESIPTELYEAARVDGASEWGCFKQITLPLLMPVVRISATLSVVGSLKYFDLIYVMTKGGPAHASELVATYVFKQGIEAGQVGRGSALAVALFAIVFCAAGGFLIASARGRREI